MKAVSYSAFGRRDVLTFSDIAEPTPKPGERSGVRLQGRRNHGYTECRIRFRIRFFRFTPRGKTENRIINGAFVGIAVLIRRAFVCGFVVRPGVVAGRALVLPRGFTRSLDVFGFARHCVPSLTPRTATTISTMPSADGGPL